MEPSSQTAAAAGILGIVVLVAFAAIVIISLVCWIKVLIALFKKEGAGLGILGLLCSIYAFIWGWMKSAELGLKKTMIWWTICIVGSVVLWFVAVAGAMGVAASDPAFQKEFQKALEEGQKKAREQQEEAPAPAEQPANQN